MSATLTVARKSIGVEVRRGTYDVLLDGERAGSVALHDTIEMPVETGRHTLQVRSGRNSSRPQTFGAVEDDVVAYRCGGSGLCRSFSCRSSCRAWRSRSGASFSGGAATLIGKQIGSSVSTKHKHPTCSV